MKLPDCADGMETPLLVTQPPGKLALFVERIGKRRRTTAKKFTDVHAALDWCAQERITFIYLPAPDHSGN